MTAALADRSNAASFRLVSACVAVGLAGQVVFFALLASRAGAAQGHYFQAPLLGLVHLCVLGWLLPITVGALHQLVPVVAERAPAPAWVGWLGLGLYVPGAAVFVARFDAFDVYRPGFPLAAALVATAILVWTAGLGVTLLGSGARSLTRAYVLAALAWLVVAVGLGVALAWNLYRPWLAVDHLRALRAHAHAAGLGFFGLLIMGVAYRLLEMFLVAPVRDLRAGRVALVAVNLALVALVAGFLAAATPLVALGVVAGGVGITAFVVQVVRIVRARQRRALDVAFAHTRASMVYLGLAALAGAALALAPLDAAAQERLALAYGLLALPGFVGSVIAGQLYKILPFLVWLHRLSPLVGLRRVPAAGDLLGPRPQRVQYRLMHAGLAALVVGLLAGAPALIAAGAGLGLASALLLAANLIHVWRVQP
jgi:hypothetical protein